jgi:hypothetical protein
VTSFGIRAELIRDDYSPFDGDLVNKQVRWADSIESAEDIVRDMGVDPDILTEPWKCDYPL